MYTVRQNQLILQGSKPVLMPYEIRKVIESSVTIMVLLTVPPAASMTENIFAVDFDGNIVWQIERIPETSLHPQLWYADMELINGSLLRAYNWNGCAVEVDTGSGMVGKRTWSK